MTAGTITSDVDGPIGTLTLANPARRNAMNLAMYRSVPEAVRRLTSDPQVRVIVIRGAGDESFGAGSDIAEFPSQRLGDDNTAAYDEAEHDAWMALALAPVPVLACIHGICMGGAIALAVHADIRIAAQDATFSIPPARLGVAYPSAAVARLVSLVGPSRAKRLLYTAESVDAREALRLGLIDEIVPKHELDDHVRALATTMAGRAPLSIQAAKVAVDHHSVGEPDHPAVTDAVRRCYESDDYREGIAAFLEKRRPEFHGS